MSLYIRLQTGFYTSRKTLRLKQLIGDAAYWIPPRLWCYAAENQPDGIFQDYTADELSMLLAYAGNAQAMLQALVQANFMDTDPLRIHNWNEHNTYHRMFSIRASHAAKARWGGAKPEIPPPSTPPKDRIRQDRIGEEQALPKQCASNAQASIVKSHNTTPQVSEKRKEGDGKFKNSPSLGEATEHFDGTKANFSRQEIKRAWQSFEATAVDGIWMWGKRPVTDWRHALECRINDMRDRNPNQDTARKADEALIKAIRGVRV